MVDLHTRRILPVRWPTTEMGWRSKRPARVMRSFKSFGDAFELQEAIGNFVGVLENVSDTMYGLGFRMLWDLAHFSTFSAPSFLLFGPPLMTKRPVSEKNDFEKTDIGP